MATKLHHIFTITRLAANGHVSDDSILDEPFVYHCLNTSRAMLLSRKATRESLSPQSQQSFCMDLELTMFHDCSCLPIESDCKILRGKYKLPEYLTKGSIPLIMLRTLDGKVINYLPLEAGDKKQYSLVNKDAITWFIHDKYLYIQGTTYFKSILVTGIFESPDSISIFKKCDTNETCYNSETDEYPIESSLISALYAETLRLISAKDNRPNDLENDGKDH